MNKGVLSYHMLREEAFFCPCLTLFGASNIIPSGTPSDLMCILLLFALDWKQSKTITIFGHLNGHESECPDLANRVHLIPYFMLILFLVSL